MGAMDWFDLTKPVNYGHGAQSFMIHVCVNESQSQAIAIFDQRDGAFRSADSAFACPICAHGIIYHRQSGE